MEIINNNRSVVVIERRAPLVIRPLYGPGARGQQGVPGPPGEGVAGATHIQGVAELVWVFNHNMGYVPAISTFDSEGEIVGDVSHPSVNQSIITFAYPVSGTAYAS